jgi:hypothetical protein
LKRELSFAHVAAVKLAQWAPALKYRPWSEQIPSSARTDAEPLLKLENPGTMTSKY